MKAQEISSSQQAQDQIKCERRNAVIPSEVFAIKQKNKKYDAAIQKILKRAKRTDW